MAEERSWFKRHINWALFLVVLALSTIGTTALSLAANYAPTWVFWVGVSISALTYYGIFDYTLAVKGRKENNANMSFGWVLLWMTGWLGVTVLLLVKARQDN